MLAIIASLVTLCMVCDVSSCLSLLGVFVCPADPERQKECEELLGPLSSERFAELVALGKLITDYVGEGEAVAPTDEDRMDEDIGVAVEVSDTHICICGAFRAGCEQGLLR